MSITDRNAAIVYAAMLDDTRPRPPSLMKIARSCDAAWNELARAARYRGLKCPGDDRAENIIHAMFRMLVKANGMNVDDLAKVIELTDEASR